MAQHGCVPSYSLIIHPRPQPQAEGGVGFSFIPVPVQVVKMQVETRPLQVRSIDTQGPSWVHLLPRLNPHLMKEGVVLFYWFTGSVLPASSGCPLLDSPGNRVWDSCLGR